MDLLLKDFRLWLKRLFAQMVTAGRSGLLSTSIVVRWTTLNLDMWNEKYISDRLLWGVSPKTFDSCLSYFKYPETNSMDWIVDKTIPAIRIIIQNIFQYNELLLAMWLNPGRDVVFENCRAKSTHWEHMPLPSASESSPTISQGLLFKGKSHLVTRYV